jgi:hypothetical protein
MSLPSWSTRTSSEPESRTESRAAGDGPSNEPAAENGKALSARDTSHDGLVSAWRKTNKKAI